MRSFSNDTKAIMKNVDFFEEDISLWYKYVQFEITTNCSMSPAAEIKILRKIEYKI